MAYDYVAGYARADSILMSNPNPGINGVSIWDLRGDAPSLTFFGLDATCQHAVLDPLTDYVPEPDDYSDFTLNSVTFWNRALAEKWVDLNGNYIFVDVFTRNLVGKGNAKNMSDPESQAFDYTIWDWSEETPDGTLFILPNTFSCSEVESTPLARTRAVSFGKPSCKQKCNGCKSSIGKMVKTMCQGGKQGQAKWCKLNQPKVDECPEVLESACQKDGTGLTADAFCKMMRLCPC